MQGQQEPKLLALVGLTLASPRSPLRGAILEDDSPRSPGFGQQMPLGVTSFPAGQGGIAPSVLASWRAGNPAWRDPIAYSVRTCPTHPLSSSCLVAWFLFKAFYISHS